MIFQTLQEKEQNGIVFNIQWQLCVNIFLPRCSKNASLDYLKECVTEIR